MATAPMRRDGVGSDLFLILGPGGLDDGGDAPGAPLDGGGRGPGAAERDAAAVLRVRLRVALDVLRPTGVWVSSAWPEHRKWPLCLHAVGRAEAARSVAIAAAEAAGAARSGGAAAVGALVDGPGGRAPPPLRRAWRYSAVIKARPDLVLLRPLPSFSALRDFYADSDDDADADPGDDDDDDVLRGVPVLLAPFYEAAPTLALGRRVDGADDADDADGASACRAAFTVATRANDVLLIMPRRLAGPTLALGAGSHEVTVDAAARAAHCGTAHDRSVHCALLAHLKQRYIAAAVHPLVVRVRRAFGVCAPVRARVEAAARAIADNGPAFDPRARTWNGNIFNSVC